MQANGLVRLKDSGNNEQGEDIQAKEEIGKRNVFQASKSPRQGVFRVWYHGGRRQSSDDSFHSPTVIPP